jgi:hypothetical protein
MQYDIIGDIHGMADKLEGLLMKLGYTMEGGIYRLEGHSAVFVGDFIDRGVQNRRVIEIVRNMVDSGNAYAVMGNHEYNAICYHTKKTKTDYLRSHKWKNFHQHETFLNEYPLGHSDTDEVIEWFKNLPLFLELDGFHVVHACWDQEAINQLKPYLVGGNVLRHELIAESATKGNQLFNIIERLLKGVEVTLPDYILPFIDKDGATRRKIRVKWWNNGSGTSYRDMAIGYDDDIIAKFPNDISPDNLEIPIYDNDTPVFYGHYWLTGTPGLQSENACCVDYSAGIGGNLVAYTITISNADRTLVAENFEWFK